MDPVTWITNASAWIQGALTPLGLLGLATGLILWFFGRFTDSPNTSSWGTKVGVAGCVLTVAPAFIGAGQFLAQRVTGG
jgi:hypothetical protein